MKDQIKKIITTKRVKSRWVMPLILIIEDEEDILELLNIPSKEGIWNNRFLTVDKMLETYLIERTLI